MLSMLKYLRTVPLLGLSILLLAQPGSQAQTLAMARKVTEPRAIQQSAYRPLGEVLADLRAHYRADILFEPKTVEGLRVDPGTVNKGRSLEQNLGSLLSPLGLKYKR